MKLILIAVLLISLLGISFLFILSITKPPIKMKISDINEKNTNNLVQVTGKITKIKNYNTFKIITVKDSTGNLDIITESNLEKNESVSVIGKVQEYKNQLQIKAKNIISLKLL